MSLNDFLPHAFLKQTKQKKLHLPITRRKKERKNKKPTEIDNKKKRKKIIKCVLSFEFSFPHFEHKKKKKITLQTCNMKEEDVEELNYD